MTDHLQDGTFDPFEFQSDGTEIGLKKPVIVDKPWGEEHWLVFNQKYALKILIVRRGHRFSLQYHSVKVETWQVTSGKMKVTFGQDKRSLTEMQVHPGQVFHVPHGLIHRVEAVGDEDLVFIEVSTPELADTRRIEDDYERT